MNCYTRLTLKEREEISRMLAVNRSLRSIGRVLGRSPSSISRELRRNKTLPSTYRAVEAQRHASKLSHKPRRKRKLVVNLKLREQVLKLLAKRWSPEQIANYLKKSYAKDSDMHISHESIYTYLYVLPRGSLKKELIHYLRRKHNVRFPRKKYRRKSSPIQDIVSIEERPMEVAERTVPGHWEGDLIIGPLNQSALGTLVERTTRFTLLVYLRAQNAASVRRAFARELRTLPRQLKRSLTYDQGKEMREHRLFTKSTRMKVYFAHPHSPWERGTNENTNGLIRQFFPKGTNFNTVTKREIKQVQTLFNERPRKVLKWNSPAEEFNKLLVNCCTSN